MPDGTFRIGWLSFGHTYYYCGNDGAIIYGKHQIDGKWYYFDENGIRQQSTWLELDGKKYYAMPDGAFREGWLSFGRTYYFCEKGGAIVYGKKPVGTKWYFFNEDGVRQESTWLELDGKKYYAMPDGDFRTGWLSFGRTYYYCGGLDGAIVYGKQKIDGKWYYFDENGVRQQSTWLELDGKKYYAMPDGDFRIGWLSFGSTYYYCGSDGAIITDRDFAVKGVLYTFDKNGVRQVTPGWGEYDGKKYYINPSTGFPYTGWVTFGSTWYYADNNGFMVTGWRSIDGDRYYFDPNTYIMVRDKKVDGIYIGSDGKASEAYVYASEILDQVGWNLRAAYNWCLGLKYVHMVENPSLGSEWYAIYGYKNRKGNCYSMAGTFYYMAKLLGYDAHQIAGYVKTVNGKSPHSWVEITIEGQTYVFDVSFENGRGINGYYFTYGTPGTWMYTDYYEMN